MVDWTDSEASFGIFGVYSAKDTCTDSSKLSYGTRTGENVASSVVFQQSLREDRTIKLPPETASVTRSESFSPTELSGELWADKYDRSNDPAVIAARSRFLIAINVLGPISLINSIYSLWVWQTFLKAARVYTDFNYAWFSAFFVNGLLWMPLTVQWPIVPFGEEVMLRFLAFFARMTLTGVFGAYWITAAAIYYTAFMEPDQSQSTFDADSTDAALNLGGYVGLAALDSAISLWFVPQVTEYADMIKQAEDFKKAVR